MTDFFEQKKKNKQLFRECINKSIKQENMIEQSDQFNSDNLHELLDFCKDGNSGKINLDDLYTQIKTQEGGHFLNRSNFNAIFGQRKDIKMTEFISVIKKFELDSFNFVEQSMKYFFENGCLKANKLEDVSHKTSKQTMTEKGKQLLIQSFDFDEDGKVTQTDLHTLFQMLREDDFLEYNKNFGSP